MSIIQTTKGLGQYIFFPENSHYLLSLSLELFKSKARLISLPEQPVKKHNLVGCIGV